MISINGNRNPLKNTTPFTIYLRGHKNSLVISVTMDSDKIKSWEVLLADAVGEDAAVRILYDTATRPLRWISQRGGRPDDASRRSNARKRR